MKKKSAGRTNEKVYCAAELADEWGVTPDVIYEVFRNEPGIRLCIEIPLSVAVRVHARIMAQAADVPGSK
jgi:hypothetical protein